MSDRKKAHGAQSNVQPSPLSQEFATLEEEQACNDIFLGALAGQDVQTKTGDEQSAAIFGSLLRSTFLDKAQKADPEQPEPPSSPEQLAEDAARREARLKKLLDRLAKLEPGAPE